MQSTKLIQGHPFILHQKEVFPADIMEKRSADFYAWMDTRRTVRDFSDKPVPKSVIRDILLTASTAPSGAHKQPWTFCAVSDPILKKEMREAAEAEEKKSYEERMPQEWLEDLAALGTDWHKPFLETAPWLIVVFRRIYERDEAGGIRSNYYVSESCGLACGFLLTAIHEAGLVALTHTPSPMQFLHRLLQRPENEKPFLLIPVGYPADPCWVPDLHRKNEEQVITWYE